MKLRKITKTGYNALLLNVSGFVPDDWEYVEVEQVKSTKDTVILKLTAVKVEKAVASNSEEVSKTIT